MRVTKQLVLIRHGQTEWSRSGRHTGRTDITLTERGREEARLIGPTLDQWDFAHVVSSPLSRAHETAQLSGLEQRILLLDDLLEWDYGVHEGRTNTDIVAETPGWSKWTDTIEDGESAEDVAVRADRAIAQLDAMADDGPVAVFAHGHLLAILIARWLGLSPTDGRRFVLDTATATVLSTKRDERVLRLFNHRCGAAAVVSDELIV